MLAHQEETRIVKAALKAAAIQAKVGHGSGTSWAWLEVRVLRPEDAPHVESDTAGHARNCPGCLWHSETRNKVIGIVQAVTGRHGDYDGQITFSVDVLFQTGAGEAK